LLFFFLFIFVAVHSELVPKLSTSVDGSNLPTINAAAGDMWWMQVFPAQQYNYTGFKGRFISSVGVQIGLYSYNHSTNVATMVYSTTTGPLNGLINVNFPRITLDSAALVVVTSSSAYTLFYDTPEQAAQLLADDVMTSGYTSLPSSYSLTVPSQYYQQELFLYLVADNVPGQAYVVLNYYNYIPASVNLNPYQVQYVQLIYRQEKQGKTKFPWTSTHTFDLGDDIAYFTAQGVHNLNFQTTYQAKVHIRYVDKTTYRSGFFTFSTLENNIPDAYDDD